MFQKKSRVGKAIDWVAPPKGMSQRRARITAALVAGVGAAILAAIFGVKERDAQ